LVANLIKDNYGAYILNTDKIAKEQMEVGKASYELVVALFGKEILSEDKTINRGKLAEIVFHDKEKLLKLNEVTHPLVLEAVQEKIISLKKQDAIPYLVIETALMIESGYDTICDEVWYVYAPKEDRRKRLMEERNYTDEKVNSIFASQSTSKDFRNKYEKVIENTGDIDNLRQQVDMLI